MKYILTVVVALGLSGCGPSETERQAAKADKEASARKYDAEMAAGPKVTRHERDGLSVWLLDIPNQFSPGGHVFWERCVAAATPGHKASLSCKGHGPNEEDIDLSDGRPIDDVRGR